VECDETKPDCLKCTFSGRVCDYWQLSEDPLPPAPPADVFCDDGDEDEEQPEAAARTDNFSLEETVNPLALGASAGSDVSEPARSRAMSDGVPSERSSSQKPPPRGLGYPSSEPVDILDQEKVSTAERIRRLERAITRGVLYGMISDIRNLQDRKKNLEENEEEDEEEKRPAKVIESGDSAVSFKTSNFLNFAETLHKKTPSPSTLPTDSRTKVDAVPEGQNSHNQLGSSISTDIAPLKGLGKVVQGAISSEVRRAKVRGMKKSDKTRQMGKKTTTLDFKLSRQLAEKKNNGAWGSTRTNILGGHSSPLLSNRRSYFDSFTAE
jgi:hypothetical protein